MSLLVAVLEWKRGEDRKCISLSPQKPHHRNPRSVVGGGGAIAVAVWSCVSPLLFFQPLLSRKEKGRGIFGVWNCGGGSNLSVFKSRKGEGGGVVVEKEG